MPSQVYHARLGLTREDGDVPKEWRFGGDYVRTGLITDKSLFSFVWLQPNFMSEDSGRPTHRHPYDQIVYLISGNGFVMHIGNREIDGEAEQNIEMTPGDALYIPQGVTHSATVGDEPVHIFESFAPLRTDYLYIAEHQLAFNAPDRQADGSRIETRGWDEMTHQREVAVHRI